MVKIWLQRETHVVADQRDHYIVTVSRVPCVGEVIRSPGTSKRGVEKPAGYYEVTSVVHHANHDKGAVAAEVGVKMHSPE